jgi:hypothetical protein
MNFFFLENVTRFYTNLLFTFNRVSIELFNVIRKENIKYKHIENGVTKAYEINVRKKCFLRVNISCCYLVVFRLQEKNKINKNDF